MGHALWYTSRATGLVSLVLFTVVVVLGAANVARFATARWPRFVISTVHRNLSLLALTFIAVHVATSIIDPYAGIGWLDAVIPFQSVYKPFWLGLGAAAGDLLVAIIVTSLLRLHIGLRWWRLVHWRSRQLSRRRSHASRRNRPVVRAKRGRRAPCRRVGRLSVTVALRSSAPLRGSSGTGSHFSC